MADKNKGGRPPKFDAAEINKALETFIMENNEPLIQEFTLNYGISQSRFYDLAKDNEKLSETIKKALTKQELYLIKQTQAGNINPTFAIFRLKQKQFGWTDKQEVDSKVTATNTNVNIDADYSTLISKATPEELERINAGDITVAEVEGIMKR